MRLSLARLAAVAGGAVLTACTLLVDTSDLGPRLGPEHELEGDARVGLDANTSSSNEDAAVDAAGNPPAAFCASLSPVPAFCEDFDGETPTGWETTMSPGGTLTTDDLTSTSPPRSLRATLPNPAAAPCKYASQSRELSVPFATRVRFGFSVRVGHVGQSGGAPDPFIPAELRLSNASGGGECGYYFILSSTRAVMSIEGAATQGYPLSSGVAAGKWVRIELVVEKTGRASVTFDGTAVLSDQLPAACGFDRVSELDLGVICLQPGSGDADLRLDDIAVQAE